MSSLKYQEESVVNTIQKISDSKFQFSPKESFHRSKESVSRNLYTKYTYALILLFLSQWIFYKVVGTLSHLWPADSFCPVASGGVSAGGGTEGRGGGVSPVGACSVDILCDLFIQKTGHNMSLKTLNI